jgi:hypothetical protein
MERSLRTDESHVAELLDRRGSSYGLFQRGDRQKVRVNGEHYSLGLEKGSVMEKFLFIVACESTRDEAEEFVENLRVIVAVDALWAVGDLVPVADQVSVKEAVTWLST